VLATGTGWLVAASSLSSSTVSAVPVADPLRTPVGRVLAGVGRFPNLPAARQTLPCARPRLLPTCITMQRRSPAELPDLMAIRAGGRHASHRRYRPPWGRHHSAQKGLLMVGT